ncbi:hypothetical protein K9M74_02895 [Candidatus Woesearchaeota archaeon]|nr:hypothetical protein [Candidatus Woesearchaeota archaeon]
MTTSFNPLVGLEIEFHLVDETGSIANDADYVLQHPKNDAYAVSELSNAMIEVLCKPATDLLDLAKDVISRVQHTLSLAKEKNLSLLPSTPIGDEVIEKRKGPRYNKKNVILGDERRSLELHICGTHIHIDKYEQDIVKQHTVMTALDPLFALMSSSPFFKFKNSLNNYRAEIYRKLVFEEFPEYGELLPYAYSIDELEVRQDTLYDKWLDICKKYGFNDEGFTRLNTCWGPIRFSQKTIESRSCDTNLVSNVLALATVFAGFNRQLDVITKTDDGYLYGENLLPSFEKLLEFQERAIESGIQDGELHTYLSSLVEFARNGLLEKEKILLFPFERMLTSKRNFSDEITSFAKDGGYYKDSSISAQGSTELRFYLSKKLEEDLDECFVLCR